MGEGNNARIIQKGTSANNKKLAIEDTTTNGLIVFIGRATSNAQAISANNVLTMGTWNHVCGSWTSGSAPQIYVNGREVGYASQTAGSGAIDDESSGSLYIGNQDTQDKTFNGSIDEAKVYNYVLTPTQIKTLYNGGAVRFGPNVGSP
jgi:hypothetical protein